MACTCPMYLNPAIMRPIHEACAAHKRALANQPQERPRQDERTGANNDDYGASAPAYLVMTTCGDDSGYESWDSHQRERYRRRKALVALGIIVKHEHALYNKVWDAKPRVNEPTSWKRVRAEWAMQSRNLPKRLRVALLHWPVPMGYHFRRNALWLGEEMVCRCPTVAEKIRLVIAIHRDRDLRGVKVNWGGRKQN